MRILVTSSVNEEVGGLISSAFRNSGHESVLFFDDNNSSMIFFNVLTQSPFRQTAKRLLQNYKRKIGRALLLKVSQYKPDLVLVVQGNYFSKEDVKKIKDEYKIPVVNWLIHDPVLTEFYDPFRIIDLAEYSQLFIADELWWPGVYFFERKVNRLLRSGDPAVYRPLDLKKDIDIFFNGDLFPPSPHTTTGLVHGRVLAHLMRQGFAVQAVAANVSLLQSFVPELKYLNVIRKKTTDQELNIWYNRSKIVLNLFPLDYKKDPAQSLFDVALSGSFQAVEYKSNIEKMFLRGIVSFQSLKELVAVLGRFLNDEPARQSLAREAYVITRERHTYQKRVEKLLAIVHE